MYNYRLLIAWLLLLVPTLLLGIGALRLLGSEEARRNDSVRQVALERVQAIADNLDLGIAEVEEGLMTTLRQFGGVEVAIALDDWKRENPLVRNVFVWERGRGLLFPDPERPASDEEAQFVRRYLPLFAGQADWQAPVADLPAAPAAADNILAQRQELRSLARQAPAPAAEMSSASVSGIADVSASPGESGWLTWFADNQLHLLGWYRPAGSAQRIGVEIEMMALLSRLLAAFPAEASGAGTSALLDGAGSVFHQSGPLMITPETRPFASAIIPRLPHWQVVAYPSAAAGGAASRFLLVTSLLVGTFVAAILLGGTLLLRQAFREQRDARQKTSFVASVSHELKTPLTTIRMYAELLDEGRVEAVDKRQRYLQTIVRESQRLTRLVNNILDFSRLEQGRREYARETLDLVPVLNDLLDSQAVRVAEAGMHLRREIAPSTASWIGDRDALEQIILNLLDNALKYASGGGVVRIRLDGDTTIWRLAVCDSGPGIPVAQRQKVFEKFHRIDDSLTARQQGAGLGLSIARQLAEGLGGELCCLEQPGGGGCCFELILPMGRLS
jgi:signal transduction histidine kinase